MELEWEVRFAGDGRYGYGAGHGKTPAEALEALSASCAANVEQAESALAERKEALAKWEERRAKLAEMGMIPT